MKILKRAYAIENTLKHMTIFIEEGGLLAGNQASVNRAAPIFPAEKRYPVQFCTQSGHYLRAERPSLCKFSGCFMSYACGSCLVRHPLLAIEPPAPESVPAESLPYSSARRRIRSS